MKSRYSAHLRKMPLICGLLLLMDAPCLLMGEPTATAVSAFNSYSKAVESRLAQQHRPPNTFLALPSSDPEDMKRRLREGSSSSRSSRPPETPTSPERSYTTGAEQPLLPEPRPQTSSGWCATSTPIRETSLPR